MLDVVKFTWRNAHGYWIPVAWTTAVSDRSDESLRSAAAIGRPGMTDFKVLDRVTIPEELRLTGRSSWLLAQVVLYDKNSSNYTAQQFLEAMLVVTA